MGLDRSGKSRSRTPAFWQLIFLCLFGQCDSHNLMGLLRLAM